MGKKRSIGLVFALAAFAFALAWIFFSPREPVYRGRPLSDWLHGYDPTIPNCPGWQEANEAVRQVGTLAIPILLEHLRRDDPAWKLRMANWARQRHMLNSKHTPAYIFNLQGKNGFVVLGSEASNAVPSLMKIYKEAISAQSQQAALASLAAIGPAASQALPLLVIATTNAEVSIRLTAIEALRTIQAPEAIWVKVLVQRLQDSDPTVNGFALYWLSRLGPAAKPAVPDLIKLLSSTNAETREDAESALHAIDPAAAGKALSELGK